MSEVAVENINVAEILGAEGAEAKVKELGDALAASPELGPLVKAAQTVEDVYEIVKKFAKGTLEQVKVIFEKTVDYFKEAKTALADEMLDYVSGGSLASFWNECKHVIVAGAIMVTAITVGVVVGAATFGVGGVIVIGGGATIAGTVAALATEGIWSAVENKTSGPKK